MASVIKFVALALLLLQLSTELSAKPAKPVTYKSCKQAADLLFLLDTSSSIWPKLFHRHVKGFLKDVVGKFNVGPGIKDTRVGVALFSSGTYLQFHLNQYWTVKDVQNAVQRMPFRGGDTYTHKALAFATDSMLKPEHGAREGMARLVVVITDGKSRNGAKTKKEANRLKAAGADIFAIGVGRRVDFEELNAMASTPSEKFAYQVTDFRALKRIMERFTQTTCQVLRSTTTSTTTTTTTTTTPTTTSTTTTPTTTTTTTTPTTTTTTTTPTTTTTTTTPTTTTTTTTPTTTTTTTTPTTTTPTTTPTTTTPTTTPTTTTPTTTTTTTTPTTTTTTIPTTTITTTTTTTTPTTTSTTTTPTTTTTTPSTTTSPTSNPTSTETSTPPLAQPLNDASRYVKACKGKPADIYFLLDASSSVWIGHFHDRVLPFVRNLVSAFDISPMKTRIGLVTFSDEVKHVFGLAKHRNLKSLLRAIQPENVAYLTGGTNTGDAISFVTKQGLGGGAARRGVAQIIITVTDGLSQSPWNTKDAAEEAKRKGIYMFSVGVGKYVDDKELADISSNPDEDFVFNVDSFAALTSITNLLAMKTCKAVALTSDDSNYKAKLDCSANPLNVMFLYEYMNSIPNSKKVRYHFITHFSHQVAQHAPQAKIGILTQPCVGGELPLTSSTRFEEEMALSRAKDHVGLPSLVKQLRRSNFYDVPLTETRVVVLVLDAHTKHHEELKKEIRKLRFQNVRIMVAAVGKVQESFVEEIASYPLLQNVIRVDSYDDLKVKDINILKHLCADEGLFPLKDESLHVSRQHVKFYGNPK